MNQQDYQDFLRSKMIPTPGKMCGRMTARAVILPSGPSVSGCGSFRKSR